jgi:Tfp pilus assembly protein PilF
VDPSHVGLYRNRGLLYEQQNQFDQARADYEQGLKLLPADAWLRDAMQRLASKKEK